MPIFGKKFEPKPAPLRLQRYRHCPSTKEDLNDFHNTSLILGNQELLFTDGNWALTSGNIKGDTVAQLKRKIKTLEERNNLTKVKVEILLDMLAENVSEKTSAQLK